MKWFLILGLTLLLGPTGCSTYKHLLEPGHDKRKEVSPERRTAAAACVSPSPCCSMTECRCGNCSETAACGCKHESQHQPSSGVTP